MLARISGLNRAMTWALAGLSGLLCALACTDFRFAALAWVALLPLLAAIDQAATLRRALLLGWLAGTVASFGTCYWMIALLARFMAVPLWIGGLLHVAFSVYQGLVFMLFAWIVRSVRERFELPMIAVAPPALVSAQFAVPYLFHYGLELSQAFTLPVIQIADLFGRLGVTALLVLGNAAAYDLIVGASRVRARAAPMRRWPVFAVAGVLIAASFSYSAVRLQQLRSQIAGASVLKIGVVQPNVVYNTSAHYRAAQNLQRLRQFVRRLATLRAASRELVLQGAQLVVWTETAYPFLFPRDLHHDYTAADSRALTAGIGAPLLAGTFTEGRDTSIIYNSALAFAAGGDIEGRYDKRELVPFGEYLPVPFNFEWVQELMQGMGGALQRGAAPQPLWLTLRPGSPPLRLSVLICNEDTLGRFIREHGRAHPDLLVNLSNDAWFGQSSEPTQHLGLAVYGVVEQRLSLVRAVNPGPSAFIDPTGRVRASTAPAEPTEDASAITTGVAALPLLHGGSTVYDRTGDLFVALCIASSLALLIACYLPRRLIAAVSARVSDC
jgi:apolipoprotein N-acyltransferase